MSDVVPLEPLLDGAHERLKTAPTLVAFVRHMNVDLFLRDADDERFEVREYDAAPTVRALFCRELAGLSWNGLYEFLSTNARAVRLAKAPRLDGRERNPKFDFM